MTLKAILFTGLTLSAAAVSAKAQVMFTIGATGTTANINNWPAAETPGLAVDALGTSKYLNFAKLNTGYIFTPASTGTVVTGISFITANDTPARDPASYVLYGSNSLTASTNPGDTFNVTTGFTQITSGNLTLSDARADASTSVSFSNAAAYNTYLLVFPTVKDAAGANSMQIAEPALQTSGGAISSTGGTVGGGVLAVPEAGSTVLLSLAGLGLITRRRRS